MLTLLLEKMTNSGDLAKWTEHGSFSADFSDAPTISPDLRENTLYADHMTFDLCGEIPTAPEIDLDVSEAPSPEIIGESQLIGSLSDFVVCDLVADGILEDCELEPALQPSFVSVSAPGHMTSRKPLLASILVHAFMIGLAAFVATTHAKGTYGCGGESIMVRVVAQEESVPVEETPASIDSAASAPSKAGKPDHHKKAENQKKNEQQREARERQIDSTRLHTESERQEPEPQDKESKKDETPRETKPGDGPTNSVASLPSVASEERRLLSAGGSDMEDFQSRILAAIREAIHFPKEALDRKKHGETVVEFTVNRDGSVSNLSIKQESGSTLLDEAALVIIRKASKNFPSIPDRVAREHINYVVPILFKEKRSRAAKN